MKGNHLTRTGVLILFSLLSTASFTKSSPLNQADTQYINTLTTEVTNAIQNTSTLVMSFVDLKDNRPLNTYIQNLQQQMLLLKKISKELKAKKKTATPVLYRQAIEQTLDILGNLNKNLITPIYKCLVGKKTKTALSPSDRADLLAAALKISIDEFHAKSSKELMNQLNQLHSYLNQLGLTTVAQTIEYVLELLVTADRNHKHSLTDAEKKAIKQAILLKIRLNKK